eukprot:12657774-Alexandrium_andersonii.AAC.1
MRLHALQSINEVFAVLTKAGQFLSDSEHAAVVKAMDEFLLTYNWLARYHYDRGEAVFHFVPKHHMLAHIAEMSKLINPTSVWCYSFESFIGL